MQASQSKIVPPDKAGCEPARSAPFPPELPGCRGFSSSIAVGAGVLRGFHSHGAGVKEVGQVTVMSVVELIGIRFGRTRRSGRLHFRNHHPLAAGRAFAFLSGISTVDLIPLAAAHACDQRFSMALISRQNCTAGERPAFV